MLEFFVLHLHFWDKFKNVSKEKNYLLGIHLIIFQRKNGILKKYLYWSSRSNWNNLLQWKQFLLLVYQTCRMKYTSDSLWGFHSSLTFRSKWCEDRKQVSDGGNVLCPMTDKLQEHHSKGRYTRLASLYIQEWSFQRQLAFRHSLTRVTKCFCSFGEEPNPLACTRGIQNLPASPSRVSVAGPQPALSPTELFVMSWKVPSPFCTSLCPLLL